jgi:queuine/archaeosine tRNA-ribosyltransferase
VQFYQELMARAREAIEQRRFADFAEDLTHRYRSASAEEDANA